MHIEDVIKKDFTNKIVVIGGYPKSGKTYLTNLLKSKYPQASFVCSDDFMEHGFKESLYKMMDHIKTIKSSTIFIEGSMFARLLRKGAELGTFYPDVIIEMIRNENDIIQEYIEKGESDKINGYHSFSKNIQTVLNSYLNGPIQKEPEWITIYNDFI